MHITQYDNLFLQETANLILYKRDFERLFFFETNQSFVFFVRETTRPLKKKRQDQKNKRKYARMIFNFFARVV